MPNIPLTPAGNWPELSTQGAWFLNFAGFGSVSSNGTSVTLAPAASVAPNDTHSALVTTTASYDVSSSPLIVEATILNNFQSRQGSAPNPWEAGWLVWNFSNNTSFYYFTLKTNGWELGQANPGFPGAQRFPATGSFPAVSLGASYNIRMIQTGNNIKVYINNVLIVNYDDTIAPYYSGKIGLYTEDASVTFSSVSIENGGPSWSGVVSVSPGSVQTPDSVTYVYTVSNTGTSGGSTAVSFAGSSNNIIDSYSTSVTGGASVVNPTGSGGAVSTNITVPVGGSVTFSIVAHPTGIGQRTATASVNAIPVLVPNYVSTSNVATDWNGVAACGSGSGSYQALPSVVGASGLIGASSNSSGVYQSWLASISSTPNPVSIAHWNGATLNVTSTVPVAVTSLTAYYWTAANVLQSAALPVTTLSNLPSGVYQLPDLPVGAVAFDHFAIQCSTSINPGGNVSVSLTTASAAGVAGPNLGVDLPCGLTAISIVNSIISSTAIVQPGGSVGWVWTITNNGPNGVIDLGISNAFASCEASRLWSVVSGSFSGGNNGSGNISGTVSIPANSSVVFQGSSVLTGSCSSSSFVGTGFVTVPAGYSNAGGNVVPSASFNVPVQSTTNIGAPVVTKTSDVAATYPGGKIVWTIVVENKNIFVLNDVVVIDEVGTGVVSRVWSSVPSSGVSGFISSGNGVLSVKGTLPPNGKIIYTVTDTLATSVGSSVSNTVTFTNNAGQAQASVTKTVAVSSTVNVIVLKTCDVKEVIGGQSISSWYVRVKNVGAATINGLRIVDPVPSNIVSQAWTVQQNGGVTGFTSVGSGAINETVSVPANAEIVYKIVALTSSTFVGEVCNQVTVTYPLGFQDVNGNTSQVLKSFVYIRGQAASLVIEPVGLIGSYTNPSVCVDSIITISLSQPVDLCAVANNHYVVSKTIKLLIDGVEQSVFVPVPKVEFVNWSGFGYMCVSNLLSWVSSLTVPPGRTLEIFAGTNVNYPVGTKLDAVNKIVLGKGVLVVAE